MASPLLLLEGRSYQLTMSDGGPPCATKAALQSRAADAVARARESFLSHSTDDDLDVRRIILASWQRSQENHVDVDHIDVPYLYDWDNTTPLLRSATADPRHAAQQLQDEPVSIILTDHTGVGARPADHQPRPDPPARRRVPVPPGTATPRSSPVPTASAPLSPVDSRPWSTDANITRIQLGQFACAGAPIHHPTRRTVIGILDLTSWAHAPGAMLMALASATARQIEDELLAQTDLREFALFQEYIKACQQSGGPVLAINDDVVMMNEHVRIIFDATEQQALLGLRRRHAPYRRSDGDPQRSSCPPARTANVKCATVGCEAGRAGTVFRVRLVQEARRAHRAWHCSRGIRSSLRTRRA